MEKSLRYKVGDWIEIIYNQVSMRNTYGFVIFHNKKKIKINSTTNKKELLNEVVDIPKKVIDTIIIE